MSGTADEGLSIHVVHGDGSARAVLLRELAAEGWRAVGVRSAAQMLDHARFFVYRRDDAEEATASADAPAAILIDWDLPDHGALHLVLQLKKQLGVRTPPLVAFASRWDPPSLRRAIQLGVDGVLPNPVEAAAVRTELKALWTRGETLSRGRLLDRAGPALLNADDGLWRIQPRQRWHAELRDLAETISRHLRRRRGLEAPDPGVDLDLTECLFGPLIERDEVDEAGLGEMMRGKERFASLDAPTRAQLAGLQREAWSTVVDHARLVDLKAKMGDRLLRAGVDLDPREAVQRLPPRPPDGHEPPQEEMRLRLLASLLRHTHPDRQVELFKVFLREGDTRVDSAVALRDILEGEGQTIAVATLRARMGLPPPPVSSQDIERLIRTQRYDAAYFAIAELVPGDPRMITLLRHLDVQMRQDGRSEEVHSVYRRAVHQNPDDLVLLTRFARARLDAGDWRGALEPLLRAERLAPDYREIRALREEAIALRTSQVLESMAAQPPGEVVLPGDVRVGVRT